MDREQHGQIWTLLGSITSYLILNAWLVTQQGRITLPGINFQKHSDGSAAVLSLIIGGVLFRALISVWTLYLLKFPGSTAYARIPAIAGWTYDPSSPLGKRVQLTFLFLFLFLPLSGLVHLNLEVYRTPTCDRKATTSEGSIDSSCVMVAEKGQGTPDRVPTPGTRKIPISFERKGRHPVPPVLGRLGVAPVEPLPSSVRLVVVVASSVGRTSETSFSRLG